MSASSFTNQMANVIDYSTSMIERKTTALEFYVKFRGKNFHHLPPSIRHGWAQEICFVEKAGCLMLKGCVKFP